MANFNNSNIEMTEWAKTFKQDSPVSYPEGLRYAVDPELEVGIIRTDENGDWVWAIQVVSDDSHGFWMDAKDTREECEALCHEMGWKVVFVNSYDVVDSREILV